MSEDFIFQFQIYLSANFAFYFLVSNRQLRTRALISFNIEIIDSVANLLSYTLFITYDVAEATFKTLLKISVLKERLNEANTEKVG